MTAPDLITNSPGLGSIRYRCGTFTSFRQAMLNRVADPDLLASAVTNLKLGVLPPDGEIAVVDAVNFPIAEPFRLKIGSEYLTVVSGAGTPVWKVLRGSPALQHGAGASVILDPENPFQRWHEGIDSDYHTMFLELWAYLGDVLTFYQERIANEAFIGTATQLDSLQRLAGLIGYRPNPGAGASGLVAFTVAKGQTVIVPQGLRIVSRALPGKPAVTFETSAAITAIDDNSMIPLAVRSRRIPYDWQTVVLTGVGRKLRVNDYLLAVENEGQQFEATHLLRIDSVVPDPAGTATTVQWHDVEGLYTQASKDISLYSFGVVAAPLGHVAPRWEFLSPVFTNSDSQHKGALFESARWDLPFLIDGIRLNAWFYIPAPGESNFSLQLDTTYDALKYTVDTPGWAALITDGDTFGAGDSFQVMHIVDARPVGKTIYSLSAQSTRLTFTESIRGFTFPFRNTQVLTGNEPLDLEVSLPLPDTLSGSVLILAGIQTQLQSGQNVVIQGIVAGTGAVAAEPAIISGPVQTDPESNITSISLKNSLGNIYVRAGCALLGNIGEVTQGETVKEEVLGSGNGSAFQNFFLAQKPVTYLPSTDPDGLSAVQSSLTVTVNDTAWTERRTLAESDPQSQDFTASLDDSGQTTISFGDGLNGARPPSGMNNIRARYRKGLGSAGNLGPSAIQQLLDNVPNLQKATNPMPLGGASDPETVSLIRRNAPSSLRTFSRAISVADYAALALTYPGIAKARATWIVTDPVTGRNVAHPYVQLTAATSDATPLQGTLLASNLRRFLDNHRDPNVQLRVQDFNPVYLQVAVTVQIDGRFGHNRTLQLVRAALNPEGNADGTKGFFSFSRMEFGRTIYLSELFAAIQSIAGVSDSNVTTMLRLGPSFPDSASSTPHDISTGPTEIAAIDPTAFPGSSLIVTGQGGLADQ